MGRCYLPEEQIPHGGMVFDYGQDLPFYNPGACLSARLRACVVSTT